MGRRKSLKERLVNFKKTVNRDFPIQTMILFGSRARGKTGRDRDVDLIIVSPRFKWLDFFERGAKMYDYWDLRMPADFLCYTPEEFKKLSRHTTIVSEAIKEGIKI